MLVAFVIDMIRRCFVVMFGATDAKDTSTNRCLFHSLCTLFVSQFLPFRYCDGATKFFPSVMSLLTMSVFVTAYADPCWAQNRIVRFDLTRIFCVVLVYLS
jgi:hypothetical protein